ncbi:hypothetical protein G5C60_12400 [Streptomyces sp. HC44]|uniref:Uncharacterized protein n=1 Tax=Streptomyces scabichelini TaxID=2711217 RepID=A0A6G4V3E6_9ACTN|nr:hypothetical protein [Streptomyces scabichelini]NGO08400.1 hypothetical protein [Streptomyces scabichelini]
MVLTSDGGVRWLHRDGVILRRVSWRITAYEGGDITSPSQDMARHR